MLNFPAVPDWGCLFRSAKQGWVFRAAQGSQTAELVPGLTDLTLFHQEVMVVARLARGLGWKENRRETKKEKGWGRSLKGIRRQQQVRGP